VAFVILSTGALTNSKLHTIGTRSLVLCVGLLMLIASAAGLALGYRMAQVDFAKLQTRTPDRLSLDEPDGRVLVERVGALSGRLNRLESDAAILARRVGVVQEFEARIGGHATAPEPQGTAAVQTTPPAPGTVPGGGPLIPVTGLSVANAVYTQQSDYGTGVAALELEIDRLQAALDLMADATNERNLEYMAFPSRLPLVGHPVNSGFGIRRDPMTGRPARHTGLDIAAPLGTPIRASAGGRVRSAGYRGPYGYVVEIDHGNGLTTRYAHLSRLYVRTGELVMPQQEIAAVGSTGRSTGPHLHFEVIRNGVQVEPRNYLARDRS
jgi:murein DD-endopeptidase MepM/ murein hydrolase activator NlpD